MKITTLSITLSAVLLVGLWSLAACTIVADDGTEYQLFAPMIGVETPAPSDDPEPSEPEPGEPEPGEPDGEIDAQVIVQFDDHALTIRSIHATAPISGLRALELSGLELTIAEMSFGPAVCAIEGVGCPAGDCFCGGDVFWGYSYWAGEAWQSHPAGAATTVISQTGAIEGWRWGEWGAPAAPAPQTQAAQEGLDWLRARQEADGSYGGSVSGGLDILLALGANRLTGDSWRGADDAPSLLDFTVQYGGEYAGASASQAGKLSLALAAAQGCYPNGASVPTDFFTPEMGSMAAESGSVALAILGTLSLEESLRDADALADSVDYLLAQAQEGGGWEWFPGWGVDTNTIALALQALIEAGVDPESPEITDAVALLRAAQNADGGFPYDAVDADAPSDANSTAYVIQGLLAAGENPHDEAWQQQGQSPVDFLLSMQAEDGGFMWQPGMDANQLSTQQAVPALLGRSYPLHAGTLARCAE